MKKLVTLLTLFLLLAIVVSADAVIAPSITATGVSLRISDSPNRADLRFKMTVALPLPDGAEIIEEGTLLVPLDINGEKEPTLDTVNVVTKARSSEKFYSYEDCYYEFTSVFENISVDYYSMAFIVRGYIIYTVDGIEKTIYSNSEIYDLYSLAQKILVSETESEDNKVFAKKIIDSFKRYLQVEKNDGLLTITAPVENNKVYPYNNDIKRYLREGEKLKSASNIDISRYPIAYQYGPKTSNEAWFDSALPVSIKWENEYQNVESFTVAYATKPDFSDALFAYAKGSESEVSVYNLYRATFYYVKVIANMKDGTHHTATSTFQTGDMGPRVIHLDGASNARDLGGYMTSSGKRTLQGLVYRSGQLDDMYGQHDTELTVFGKYTASKVLGIKVDFDFRKMTDPSPIPDATCIYIPVSGYALGSENGRDDIRKAFSVLSNINNYPIVFHCQGGADRTGTIAYLFNALLGVSELDIVRDYEFTSFSVYYYRTITHKSYIAKEDYKFFETLNAQEGDTLQERVENYLLSIGVTAEEIANIRSIMFEGTAKRSISFTPDYDISYYNGIRVLVNGSLDDISNVYVNSTNVKWNKEAGGIGVRFEDIPANLLNSEVTVKLVFKDGEEYSDRMLLSYNESISAPEAFVQLLSNDLKIKYYGLADRPSELYIGNYKTEFTLNNGVITVSPTAIDSRVKEGEVEVKLILKDKTTLTDTFIYDKTESVDLSDYIDTVTLNFGDMGTQSQPVGYGKWVKMRLESTDNSYGNMCIFVGSYGAKFSDGSTGYVRLSDSGVIDLDDRVGHNKIKQQLFRKGNTMDFYIKVDLIDEKHFKVSLMAVKQRSSELYAYQTYVGERLSEGEIAQPTVNFEIDGIATSELIIHGR